MATIRAFEPKFMKVGVLTAALQELTPRDVRDADPDRAIEDWIAFARELGADDIQLSAALHPTRSRRSARGDARSCREHARSAEAVRRAARASACDAALKSTGVGMSDIGYFDNLLHDDSGDAAQEARLHAARVRRRARCLASMQSAASSAATSSAAWTRTSSISKRYSSRC